MQKVEFESEIINIEEAMARLDVTRPTLLKWRKKGKIPFLEIGSAIRFNWPDVVKALTVDKSR